MSVVAERHDPSIQTVRFFSTLYAEQTGIESCAPFRWNCRTNNTASLQHGCVISFRSCTANSRCIASTALLKRNDGPSHGRVFRRGVAHAIGGN